MHPIFPGLALSPFPGLALRPQPLVHARCTMSTLCPWLVSQHSDHGRHGLEKACMVSGKLVGLDSLTNCATSPGELEKPRAPISGVPKNKQTKAEKVMTSGGGRQKSR